MMKSGLIAFLLVFSAFSHASMDQCWDQMTGLVGAWESSAVYCEGKNGRLQIPTGIPKKVTVQFADGIHEGYGGAILINTFDTNFNQVVPKGMFHWYFGNLLSGTKSENGECQLSYNAWTIANFGSYSVSKDKKHLVLKIDQMEANTCPSGDKLTIKMTPSMIECPVSMTDKDDDDLICKGNRNQVDPPPPDVTPAWPRPTLAPNDNGKLILECYMRDANKKIVGDLLLTFKDGVPSQNVSPSFAVTTTVLGDYACDPGVQRDETRIGYKLPMGFQASTLIPWHEAGSTYDWGSFANLDWDRITEAQYYNADTGLWSNDKKCQSRLWLAKMVSEPDKPIEGQFTYDEGDYPNVTYNLDCIDYIKFN